MPTEPKQDRSRATRLRLLEVAVTGLAENGWTATTVAMVAERAGVSRGAAQHHFPTREDLFMAAVDHMAEERGRELRSEVDELPYGPGRTYAVLDLISSFYLGPLFGAALQVWVAASSDEALRAKVIPMEARFGREVYALAADLLHVDPGDPDVRATLRATLDLLRGLGLADLLTDDSARRAVVLRHWADVVDEGLGLVDQTQ